MEHICVSGHHGKEKGYQGQGVTTSEREDLDFPLEKKNIFLFYIDHKYTISEGKINHHPKCNISDFRLKFDGISKPPPYKTISC